MKLIIDQTPLLLIPELAVKFGINGALVLQQLHFRLNSSPLKEDGYTWYQHTYESWMKQFPFLSLTTIKRTILKLEKGNYIISTTKFNPTKYDHRKWYTIDYERLYHDLGVQNEMTKSSDETITTDQISFYSDTDMTSCIKEENKKKKEIIANIIHYLNEKAGKNFKVTNQHEKIIQARLNEGNGIEDFKKVIDQKVMQWINDPKMKNYLRPSTLFRPTNFENYLNELVPESQPSKNQTPYKPIELNLDAGE